MELTDEQERYLLMACEAATGPNREVDFIEGDIAQRAGISSSERDVQLALEKVGLISSGGRLENNIATGIFEVTRAGEAYCEEHRGA